MNDKIMYPTADMTSVSHDLRSFLEMQWSQHTALFMNNQESYSTLLHTIARLLPNAGGKADALEQALTGYHHQYQSAYQALHTLADEIEKAARTMGETDQSIAQSFQGTKNTPS